MNYYMMYKSVNISNIGLFMETGFPFKLLQ